MTASARNTLKCYIATLLRCYIGRVRGKKHCEMLHNPPALSALMTTIFVRRCRPNTILFEQNSEASFRPIFFLQICFCDVCYELHNGEGPIHSPGTSRMRLENMIPVDVIQYHPCYLGISRNPSQQMTVKINTLLIMMRECTAN